MKKQTIINSIIASGLLFTGAVSASTQDSETDLIYGEQNSVPSRGEAPDRFADNRNSNTDIVYGS